MARKPTGNPTGRPIKEVDWQLFEQLCGIHCTQSEIASMLKIHHETLIYKTEAQYGEPFASVYKKYQEGGKCSLRRNQFAMSKTNATMAIWLGKQYLGQKDNDDSKLPPNDTPINNLLNDLHASKPKTNPELPGSQQTL